MTPEEINKLAFRFVSHLNMEDCHSTVYQAVTIPELQMCRRVIFRNGEPTRRGTVHYMFKGKVYKTLGKLYNAMIDFQPNAENK